MYLYITCGGAHGVIVIIIGNRLSHQSSNLKKAVCISHCTNTLRKGINPSSLHSAMSKIEGRLGFLTLVWQPA